MARSEYDRQPVMVEGENAVTVIQVARSMGIVMPPKIAWSVGTAVANAYRRKRGFPPVKILGGKTSGTGSHCFAFYPESFIPVIRDAIMAVGAESERQGSLF